MHVAAEAGRQPVGEHLDHAAERVAVLVAASISATIARARRRVDAADRVGVERGEVVRAPAAACRPATATGPIDDVWLTSRTPEACCEQRLATAPSATRAAVSRALARSSTGRASSKPYFCMPTRSAWPGRGRVSGALRASSASSAASTGSALITVCPLRPLGVADRDGHRAAQGQAVPHAAEELDLVVLERHAGAAAVAEPAAGEAWPTSPW